MIWTCLWEPWRERYRDYHHKLLVISCYSVCLLQMVFFLTGRRSCFLVWPRVRIHTYCWASRDSTESERYQTLNPSEQKECERWDWVHMLCVRRRVLIKCEFWWMRSTRTWILPCHSSPRPWWRNSISRAPGSGTRISATWRSQPSFLCHYKILTNKNIKNKSPLLY